MVGVCRVCVLTVQLLPVFTGAGGRTVDVLLLLLLLLTVVSVCLFSVSMLNDHLNS